MRPYSDRRNLNLSYVAKHAKTFDEALTMVGSETVNVISRIPLWDLISRASLVRDGLFDFDGTLHTSSTWAVVSRGLPEKLREADAAIRSWYWEQVHHGDVIFPLDHPDWFHCQMAIGNQAVVDGAWVANDIQWYIQAGLTRQDFKTVARELRARPGATELLKLMRHRAVITFGIEQVAQDWLRNRSITAAVAGTRLTFDDGGRLIGHHPNVVASPTKRFAADRFRELTRTTGREIIVVGDSVVDVHMMAKDSFNVLVVPPSEFNRELQDFRENNLAGMWDQITMMLADDSLEPLVALLQEARENT